MFCFIVQTLVILTDPLLPIIQLVIYDRILLPLAFQGRLGLLVSASYTVMLISGFVRFAILFAVKWLVLGRYVEGDYPIYGTYYLRHWLVEHFAARTIVSANGADRFTSGWNFNLGMNFQKVLMLRMLGADVSLSAIVTAPVKGFDLVRIEPLASVHGPHHVTPVSFEGKRMVVRRHHFGAGAYVGNDACVMGGASIMPGAIVEPLAAIPPATVIEGRWSGVPARQLEPSDPKRIPTAELCNKMSFAGALWCSILWLVYLTIPSVCIALHSFSELSLSGYSTWSGGDAFDSLPDSVLDGIVYAPLFAVCITFLAVWSFFLAVVLICRWLPQVKPPMNVPVWSLRAQIAALKLYLVSAVSEWIEDASIQVLFFRLCGARIGEGTCFCDQLGLPETLEIGDHCHFGSHNVLTSGHVDQGCFKVPSKTVVGNGVFMGNYNQVPEGLPDGMLCGMRTLVPERPAEGGCCLSGNPPMKFARPQQATLAPPGLLAKVWYHTSSTLIDVTFWPCLKSVEVTTALVLSRNLFPTLEHGWEFLAEMGIFFSFQFAGWFLISFIFGNIAYNDRLSQKFTLESIANMRWGNAIMARKSFPLPFRTAGTMWHGAAMRLMGAKIGKRFFSPSPHFLMDPAFAVLGDDVTLDEDAQIWQHTFEDRMLKIRPGYVGCRTTLMQASMIASSDADDDVTLRAGSVTWKGQRLEAGQVFQGAPAAPVGEDVV
jgi:carbonic anhydrase/acetyltransferase-like protein (isoleucine patch superfamily)